ncbi:hypothetical protein WMY93_012736 [Mugilogobius chulae]|uniref:Transient receptor potential cation channel subfamily M member 5 n=1 Tax=Mugilogobius chulae TaxID=88201 RepID=A0AAW0P748_9GOBI
MVPVVHQQAYRQGYGPSTDFALWISKVSRTVALSIIMVMNHVWDSPWAVSSLQSFICCKEQVKSMKGVPYLQCEWTSSAASVVEEPMHCTSPNTKTLMDSTTATAELGWTVYPVSGSSDNSVRSRFEFCLVVSVFADNSGLIYTTIAFVSVEVPALLRDLSTSASRPNQSSCVDVKREFIPLMLDFNENCRDLGGECTGSFEIPVLCLLVHGEPRILKRMYTGIENSTPWLILAGSGGVADILVSLMNRGSWDADSVHELLLDTFPQAHHSADVSNWIKLIRKILDHGHLLTVHDPEQESSELDTVILKALVKGGPGLSGRAEAGCGLEQMDIAKSDIFNGDVEWKACDLEEVMMDALINDKPDFVRLFVDNGVNLGEFLTYGRLQELYWSIPEKSLLHNLLLKKYEEKQILLRTARSKGPPGTQHQLDQPKPRFTLLEVAKVLKDFLHDSCKGFYQKVPTEKPAKGRLFHTQKNLALELEVTSEHPWRDLFLWAVLQNRQEMANYFWTMGPEAVAAALAGCKILKEMARLESEAESARRMKENKYEQFALDVFGECYSNSEDRAYALLIRRTQCWSKSTVLNLATEADAKSFFAHDGVQALLTKIWWGAMTTDTAISKLVVSFFCPPLIWTNLIKFSDEELEESNKGQFVELDSLDTEKALLLTDDDDPLDSSPGGPADQSCASMWWRFLVRRWRRFWSAPVTVFLGNVIMYFAFLILFMYVLLLDFRPPPPYGPGAPEIMLYIWVSTLVLEEIRQSFFTDEEINILKKFKLYWEDNWNKCDMVAISLFVVAVSCRMVNGTYEAGRTVLAIDFMVFTLRLIHIFAIHKQLGPKIIIVERMMKDVFFFLFFLCVWLLAYGVATQALLHPNDPRIDWVFRRALYRPYLHIFGQIPLEEIDAARMPDMNCTTDTEEIVAGLYPPCPNKYANWLVILLLVIYLLVTNVLLLNLLIAMFSYTFQVVQGNTDIFWKFQRYNLIVEYSSRPALAPPFIIISHLSQIFLSLFKQPESKQEQLEKELPPGLDQKLKTWETVQKENYLAKLERQHWESSEERLKNTASKVQSLLKIVGGFKDQEKRLVSVETQIRYCGEVLSWMAECFSLSTLKCGKDAPVAPLSLTGACASKERDKTRESEDTEDGFGAAKKYPYIDE